MSVGTYYGDNYTKMYQTTPPEMVHASKQGKLLTLIDRCVAATATGLDAGSTFYMGKKPPRGARFVSGEIYSEALGTGVTLSVGASVQKYERKTDTRDVNWGVTTTPTVADVDLFMAATAHAVVTKTSFPTAALGAVVASPVGYEMDGETSITITTAGAAIVTGKYITLVTNWVLP